MIDFSTETKTVTLTEAQIRLLCDSLRFMGEETNPDKTAYDSAFDVMTACHAGDHVFTIAFLQVLESAAMGLEGMLSETLAYSTFPERHSAFHALYEAIDIAA